MKPRVAANNQVNPRCETKEPPRGGPSLAQAEIAKSLLHLDVARGHGAQLLYIGHRDLGVALELVVGLSLEHRVLVAAVELEVQQGKHVVLALDDRRPPDSDVRDARTGGRRGVERIRQVRPVREASVGRRQLADPVLDNSVELRSLDLRGPHTRLPKGWTVNICFFVISPAGMESRMPPRLM